MKRGRRLTIKELKENMEIIAYDKTWTEEYRCIVRGIDKENGEVDLEFLEIKDSPRITYSILFVYAIGKPENPSKRE